MKPQSNVRSSTPILLAGGLMALLFVGGGATWLTYHSLSNLASRPTAPASPLQPTPIPVQEAPRPPDGATVGPQIYWLDPSSDRLSFKAEPLAAVQPVAQSANPEIILAQSLQQLLAAAAHHPEKTTIPAQSTLLSLTVKNDGIHLDLSTAFTEGGGSTSMVGRLGQVLYTATSLDPDANVWINVNGQPLELLGGEGIEVPQPLTRRYFQENFQG